MGIALRYTAALLVSGAFLGCATTNEPAKYFHTYVATQKPRAEAGEIKWSEYYRGAYSLAVAANASGETLALINESIRTADQYEAGEINQSQFEYRRRAISATQKEAADQHEQQAQMRRAAAISMMAASLQNFQIHPVQPIAQPQIKAPSAMLTGFLQGETANRDLKYCRYSNGVVTTISAVTLCPLSTN